jgi:hypothetical protein
MFSLPERSISSIGRRHPLLEGLRSHSAQNQPICDDEDETKQRSPLAFLEDYGTHQLD